MADKPVTQNEKESHAEKSRLTKAIFADDIKGAVKAVFWKQFLPRMKNAMVGTIHDTVNAVFNTKIGSGYTSGLNTYATNYQSISSGGNANYQQITTKKVSLRNDLRFDTEEDAKKVKELMEGEIQECGFVTVGKVYDWLGKPCPSTWYNYGWINIDSARIINEDGVYRLSVPNASPVDRG